MSSPKFPAVAVVIPCYNRWPHICEAVESVLAQTYPRVECVVVDDAPTEDTAEKLDGYYGNRIKVIRHKENRQKSAARNTGVRNTSADYVCMLDSDDLLTPDSVASRMQVFLEFPDFYGVAYGYAVRDNDSSAPHKARPREFPSGDVLDQYVLKRFLQNNDFLLSRANMLKYGMFREDLTNREDIELLIRLACHLPFHYCGQCVAYIRRVDQSACDDHAAFTHQGVRLIEHIKADEVVRTRLGDKLHAIEFEERMELARACYKLGDYSDFREHTFDLFKKYPWRTLRELRLLRRLLKSLFMGS